MGHPLPTDTQELLDALDRYKNVLGSLPIFDALWAGDAPALERALAEHLGHPLAEDLGRWLETRGLTRPSPPSNDEVLQRRGITDVAGWIDQHQAEVTRLKTERDDALAQRLDALKAAHGLSVVLVVVAGVAITGWLAAFGVLGFSPLPLPEQRPLPHEGGRSTTPESTLPEEK